MKNTFKKLCAIVCAISLVLSSMISAIAEETAPNYTEYYELIIDRYEEMMIGKEGAIPLDTTDEILTEKMSVISEKARKFYNSMEPIDSWATNGNHGYIWSDKETNIDLADNTSAEYNAVTVSVRRAYLIALAYRIGEADVRGNTAYRDAALNIVNFVTTHWYAPGIEQYGGWSNWQAQIPIPLYSVLTLLNNEVSEELVSQVVEAVKYYPPQHAMLGTNLTSVSMVRLYTGAFGKDDYYIDWARKGFETVAEYVTAKDGVYYDGSFVQHNMYSYNGGYGVGLLDSNVDGPLLLLDTPWDISDNCKENLIEWVYSAYEPILYKGSVMEMTNGRFVAAQSTNNSYLNGSRIVKGILNLVDIAEDIDAKYFKRLVKYMYSEASSTYNLALECYEDIGRSQSYDYIGLYTKIKALYEDETLGNREPYIMSKVYYNTDRVVQHREDYSVGISMHSNRIAGYESINGANLQGWYQGNSALWLYLDNNQFAETFFATVDPYRLAGTTVLKGAPGLPRENDGKNAKGRNSYAGGTSILGKYAVSGHYLQPIGQTLNAKKSYFLFDNEIVALGSNINSSDYDDVETTIENRRLTTQNGDNLFLVDGAETVPNLGDTATITNPKWAYLKGNTDNTSIGYYFPNGGTVNTLRETRTGAWADVDKGNAVDDYIQRTDNYLTMYINHGTTPENANYSYVLLPNASADETRAYSENSDTEILANTSDVHAVTDKKLNITGANFWNYKESTVQKDGKDYITANAPASVMVAEDEETVTITLSDPTHENTGIINLEVNVSASEILSKADEITVLQTSPSVVLAINPTEDVGYVGETMEIVLKKGENTDTTETAPTISHNNNFKIVAKETVATTSEITIDGTRPITISVENVSEKAEVTVDRFGKIYISNNIPLGKYSFDIVATNDYGTARQTFQLMILSNIEPKKPAKSVIYYPFNEGFGTTAESITTTKYSGAIDFNATLSENAEWVDGFVGTALKFNGTDDTLSMNHSTGYNYDTIGMNPKNSNFGGNTEYDFWVKFDEKITADQIIFSKIGNTTPYAVKITANGKLGFCVRNSWIYSDNTLDWNVGEWYHINIVHSYNADSTPLYTITLKRDGILVGTSDFDKDINGITSVLTINGNSKYASQSFNGTIDELYLGALGGGEEIRLRSKVNFNTNGGSNISPQYVDLDKTATDPEEIPTKENYVFGGWYSDSALTQKYDFTSPVTTDITLYAKWVNYGRTESKTPKNSFVYYNFNEGIGNTANSQSTHPKISSKYSAFDFNATLSDTTDWVQGFVGAGVNFDNISDTFKMNSYDAFDYAISMKPSASGTVEYDFWVKLNENPITTKREQIIMLRSNYNRLIMWGIKINASGQITLIINGTDNSSNVLDWNTDEWYHINITQNRDYLVTFKRDGKSVGNITASGQPGTSKVGLYVNNTTDKNARNVITEENYFNGVLDELCLGTVGVGESVRVRSKVNFATDCDQYIEPQYPFYDETAINVTPTKTGYKFIGWYTDKDFSTAYDFSQIVTNDITLYAKWEKSAVLGDADGNGEITTEDMVILRQYLLGTLKTQIADIKVLDVTADGVINLKDLVRYKRYFSGIIPSLG